MRKAAIVLTICAAFMGLLPGAGVAWADDPIDPAYLPSLGSCPQMAYGDHSDCVQALQYSFIAMGVSVAQDGFYGDQTLAAVKAFQEAHPPLVVDGIAGPETIAAVDRIANSPAALPPPGQSVQAAPSGDATPGASPKEISRTDIPVLPALGKYRVGFFIMQSSYGISGASGAGDGRGFDQQAKPSQNRVYLEVDYVAGTARIMVNPSCNTDRTECNDPVPLSDDRVSIAFSRANVSSANPITFTKFHVNIENSRETVNGFPRIRSEISFNTNPQGGLSIEGQTSSFPSVEIYHDSGPSTTTVYQHEQARIAGAAALGIPALDQSFGINVFEDGQVDRAY